MNVSQSYRDVVAWIGDGTGQPDTILHIHGGMAVLMLARVLSGRSLGSFIPFAFTAVATVAKEVLDRLAHGSWRWGDTVPDIANTLFWPLVITLAVRWRPMIGRDRRSLGRARS